MVESHISKKLNFYKSVLKTVQLPKGWVKETSSSIPCWYYTNSTEIFIHQKSTIFSLAVDV